MCCQYCSAILSSAYCSCRKSIKKEKCKESKPKTPPPSINIDDDNSHMLIGPWLSTGGNSKSAKGSNASSSSDDDHAATLIVCPLSVLSNWTVSMQSPFPISPSTTNVSVHVKKKHKGAIYLNGVFVVWVLLKGSLVAHGPQPSLQFVAPWPTSRPTPQRPVVHFTVREKILHHQVHAFVCMGVHTVYRGSNIFSLRKKQQLQRGLK